MRTESVSTADINKNWYVIDATDQSLGRLASRVASVLHGKHRPEFTRHSDTGDFVIVINASKIKLTGNKLEAKKYQHHSGYPGGLTTEAYKDLIVRKPTFVIEKAVKGMLPKTTMGRLQLRHLKVYEGETHPHAAQQPQPFTF